MSENNGSGPLKKPILWRQKSTDTVFEFVGEDRGDAGEPYALMRTADGTFTRRVDPLDMMEINGDWEKV